MGSESHSQVTHPGPVAIPLSQVYMSLVALGPSQDSSTSLFLPFFPIAPHLLLCAAQRTHRPRLPLRASLVGEEWPASCAVGLCSPLPRGWVYRFPLATGCVMSQGILPGPPELEVGLCPGQRQGGTGNGAEPERRFLVPLAWDRPYKTDSALAG